MRFLPLLLLTAICHAETAVTIQGEDFHINDKPTYAGREWQGHRIEGLLMNSRMVQGTFDDRNPETVKNWVYPDTQKWDADRNTNEFIAAMPEWRAHGLLAFTLNFQGGSPYGYSKDQPWHNSAINDDGTLDEKFLARTERIIAKADELGMVVILGIFYFGQDQRQKDEQAVIAAVEATTRWVLGKKWLHVVLEINNETNIPKYDHDILKTKRVHELIQRAKSIEVDGRRLLVGTSFGGGGVPSKNVIEHSDFLLIHGNGVKGPDAMRKFIEKVKAARGERKFPIVVNEDDHFDFEQPDNNMTAAVKEHVSWGYFDFRRKDATQAFNDGYQSVPVNWDISSERKKGFFKLLKEITGE
ncbi:MAG TPA: hypothetical protein VGE39_20665 [Prosthecobacter sp.]